MIDSLMIFIDVCICTPGKALVYGCTLEAYTMVQGLLAVGVPSDRIVMVHPPPPIPSCFNNLEIDEAIEQALSDLGKMITT